MSLNNCQIVVHIMEVQWSPTFVVINVLMLSSFSAVIIKLRQILISEYFHPYGHCHCSAVKYMMELLPKNYAIILQSFKFKLRSV